MRLVKRVDGVLVRFRKKNNAEIPSEAPTSIILIFLLSFPTVFFYPLWEKIYTNTLILYLTIVFFESIRLSKKPLLFLGTFFAILIGNITPGIGTLIKILGFNLNSKKIYKNF